MSKTRILIDTNVLIALEDPGQTDFVAADFARRCQAGGITIFLPSATRRDFERDGDDRRRSISTSRMNKYPCLSDIPLPARAELQARFGPIRSDNDAVDIALLHALWIDAVDLLVSQDDGVHKRVRGGALEERVLTLADALAWLKALQDPVDDGLRQVVDVPAYSVATADAIFESLREDYASFDNWWRDRCIAEHRRCWIVFGDGRLDGIVIRKTEHGEAVGLDPHKKVLKLCTFKVTSEARGHKVGELLLRKALWHAQLNTFDAAYLTTFAKQTMLIDLLERYGFEKRGERADGEAVYVKTISRERLELPADADLAVLARTHYPRFNVRAPVSLFAVPVLWAFHRQLFPEIARLTALPLFNDTSFDERGARQVAGNTIRKVYVCHSRNTKLKGGDVLFFYQSKDVAAHHSQRLTTVGIVEQVRRARDTRELIRLTAGRSVFSEHDLETLSSRASNGVMVIDFLLVGHLEPPLGLGQLIAEGVLSAPPQTITQIASIALSALLPSMNFGFAL